MTTAVYLQVNRFFPPEITQRACIQQILAKAKIAPSSVQWFIDRESKSEFQQLSEDIKNGSIQAIILYSLEQAYPSLASITAAFELFTSKNMSFSVASQNMSFDQTNIKSATLLLNAALSLSDYHYRIKQAEGIAKAREKGLYRGKKPGAIKPGVDMKKVSRLRERGFTAKRIAKKIGVCESTVYRYFRMLSQK